jgi:uncharacterized membrane protein HdeD (DUF308 family)
MAYPPDQIGQLIVLVAIFLIMSGLIRLVRSLAKQSRGRAWFVLAGVIALVLGISVWFGGAAARIGFVGGCIALDFLFHGVSWSAFALGERKRLEMQTSGGK